MSFAPSPLRKAAVSLFAVLGSIASAQTPLAVSHVPAIVQSGQARLVSSVSPRESLHLAIDLPLRNQAQLEAQLADLYNPQSPNFHHWLSQPEFEALYGPEPEKFTALLQWARSNGMTVTYQSSNGRIIEVDAPVSAINRAFHVTLKTYHDPLLNRDFHAPDQEPTTDLPFSLLSVGGLENSEPPQNHYRKDPAAGIPELLRASSPIAVKGPGSTGHPNVYGSGPDNMYLPSDMRAAYYGNGNLTGTGQTVGIFSFDGYLVSDLQLYYSSTGMTSTVPVTNKLVGTFSGGCVLDSPCDDGEQILDIVQVQGMAPGLTGITFYENNTTANVILNQMVTDNTCKVITSSWSGGGFGASSDTYFMQMATQGQTYLNATGDSGAYDRGTYTAPGLDPYITEVGGTDLTTSGPGGVWAGEVAWAYSAGGYYANGVSSTGKYTIPTWQTAAINTTNKGSATYRNSPDMAAEANYDNPTAINGVFSPGYGGTSFATPRMAGYIALANQQAVENGSTTLGFLNPSLYSAGENASYTTYYHDITSGSNPATIAYSGTYPYYTAVTGYDLVTGWGSPNGPGLLNFLAGAPVPDFALVPAAVTLQKGGPAVQSTVSLTAYNNFSGTVNLSLSAGTVPPGVTATYTAGTPSSPPSVTLTAGSAATMSTYNVTLTGTSGSLTHTAVLPVTVGKRTADDFTITATSATVPAGQGGSSTVTVTEGAGMSGPIALAVGPLPAGITANLNYNTTPPSSTAPYAVTLTMTAAASVTPNTYTITVTGTSPGNIIHSVNIPVTVTLPPSLIVNGGFESGAASPWVFTTQSGTEGVELLTTASGIPPHTGNYFALLDGGSAASVDVMTQQVAITSGYSKATLGLWYWVLTGQTGTTPVDTMTIQLTDTSGNVLTTLGTLSNLNAGGYWAYLGFDVSGYIGQTVILKITGTQAGTTGTDFLVDDVSLTVQ